MNASKKLSVGVIVACLALLGGAIFGGTAAVAKKKKAKKVDVTKTVNLAIPDRAAGAGTQYGQLQSVIKVGNKFKNKVVSNDITVTVQTQGSANGAADHLEARLQGPGGKTVELFNGIGGAGATGIPSIGPLTLSPNTPFSVCDTPTPPCADPDNTLPRPFVGTAQANSLGGFYGTKIKGNWTLKMFDKSNTLTSSLVQWKLHITPATPIT